MTHGTRSHRRRRSRPTAGTLRPLSVRLSRDDRRLLKALAALQSTTISHVLRDLLRTYAGARLCEVSSASDPALFAAGCECE